VRCAARPLRVLVGPDNGLLARAIERFGGATEAVEISDSPERLRPVSRTFHGRDVFAPVAAALAAGARLRDIGEQTPISGLATLALPVAEFRGGGLAAHVVRTDGFGNLILDATLADVEVMAGGVGTRVEVTTGSSTHVARLALAFADVPRGELLLYEDANGALAIAANADSAARILRVGTGAELLVRSV
jgi:S-adenosylmethionine hydrolase